MLIDKIKSLADAIAADIKAIAAKTDLLKSAAYRDVGTADGEMPEFLGLNGIAGMGYAGKAIGVGTTDNIDDLKDVSGLYSGLGALSGSNTGGLPSTDISAFSLEVISSNYVAAQLLTAVESVLVDGSNQYVNKTYKRSYYYESAIWTDWEMPSDAGGGAEIDTTILLEQLKPDILNIIRDELEYYDTNRSEYFGTGWHKDKATGIVYCKDVPHGETKTFVNDPVTYISVHNVGNYHNYSAPNTTIATSNLTVMGTGVFRRFSTESRVHAKTWDMSNVINAEECFYNVDIIPDISNWDTSSLVNATEMFLGAGLKSPDLDLSKLDFSSLVIAEDMFREFKPPLDVSNWNTSSLVNAKNMFFRVKKQITGLANLDLSNLENAYGMFEYASMSLQLGALDLRKVTNGERMFNESNSLNDSGIIDSNFNLLRFRDITNAGTMFGQTRLALDVDLTGWCVKNIATEPSAFGYRISAAKKPIWGSCP